METLDAVTFRPIDDQAGYRACVELQQATWGQAFAELVPPSVLMVARKVGGLLAGAYGADDDLLGFVFGLAGLREGRPIHWSHMLAVRPDARGRGLGRHLKLHQRERLLERGLDVALWTYDPLVSRNAHLNLNRLGAVVAGYEQDLYGTDTNSPLHDKAGTDRFVVRWELGSERVRKAVDGEAPAAGHDYADAPVLTVDGASDDGDGSAPRFEPPFPRGPRVLVEIPRNVQGLKSSDPERVVLWRRLTRAALPWYLDRGYRVDGLLPAPGGGRFRYALRRPEGESGVPG
jgi:predicted GNAT superfamily acetyltransferase